MSSSYPDHRNLGYASPSESTAREHDELGHGRVVELIREEIRQLDRYAPPFADRTVVNLSLNEHCDPPSPRIRETFQGLDAAHLVTYDTELTAQLTRRIADREGVSPDNVLLFPGSSSGLQLLFSTLRKGPALLPSICWSYHITLARQCGLPICTYQLARQEDAFQVDERSIDQALQRDRPVLLLFINPHMPTGALTHSEPILRCAGAASDTLVLVDEAYHGFSRAALSVAPRVREHDNLIVSKTFSKYFGLAGIRLGYLIGGRPLIEQLAKATSPFNISFFSAALALAALDDEAYYRERAAEIMAVQDAFAGRVNAIPGVRAYRSHGNYILVELPDAAAAARAQERIYAAGVAVRSAHSYGLPSFLRIGIGQARIMDRIAEALAIECSEVVHAAG